MHSACSVAPGMLLSRVQIRDPVHDIHQMGGAIIVDQHGNVEYLQISKTSYDRPPASQVLAALSKALGRQPAHNELEGPDGNGGGG